MLKSIRGLMGSWLVILLMGVLIASFAIFGIGDIFRASGGANVVASVGKTDITAQELQKEFSRRLDMMKQRTGQALDPDLAVRLGLPQKVLDDLMIRATLDQATSDMGLRTTDAQLLKAIRENPSFQGPSGAFDRMTYERLLSENNMTPGTFESDLRRDMNRMQLANPLLAGDPPVSFMAASLFRYARERRQGSVIIFTPGEIKTAFTPKEEELQAWYKNHPDDFRTPEYRKVAFIELKPDLYAAQVQVSEADIKKAYAERQQEFKIPEKRVLSFAAFGSEAEAKAMGDKAKLGAAGSFTYDQMKQDYGAEAAGLVFALDKDETAPPVKTSFGWGLFKVTAIEKESVKPFEEVRGQIEADARKEKEMDLLYKAVSQAEDQAGNGARLDAISALLHVPVVTVEAVSQDGKTPDGAPANPAVMPYLAEAFQKKPNGDLEMTEGANESYHMLEVRGIVAARRRPFNDVKADVAAAWAQEMRRAEAERLAQKAAEKLKAGAKAEDIVREFGGKLVPLPELTRDARQEETRIPDDIHNALFRQKLNAAVVVNGVGGNAYYTIAATRIEPGDSRADPNGFAAFEQTLRQDFLNDVLMQYVGALQTAYGTTTNKALMTQIFARKTQQ